MNKRDAMHSAASALLCLSLSICLAGCLNCSKYADKQHAKTPIRNSKTDEDTIRSVVTAQFEALFERDVGKFINSYSEDYDNGDYTYAEKAKGASAAVETKFQVRDFYIEFLQSGTDEAEVHIDEDRGFGTTYAYTYWEQRTGDDEYGVAVHKLGAFLLRKEGENWRIISDKSIPLKVKGDAALLMNSSQFRAYMDPSTIKWPPPNN